MIRVLCITWLKLSLSDSVRPLISMLKYRPPSYIMDRRSRLSFTNRSSSTPSNAES